MFLAKKFSRFYLCFFMLSVLSEKRVSKWKGLYVQATQKVIKRLCCYSVWPLSSDLGDPNRSIKLHYYLAYNAAHQLKILSGSLSMLYISNILSAD